MYFRKREWLSGVATLALVSGLINVASAQPGQPNEPKATPVVQQNGQPNQTPGQRQGGPATVPQQTQQGQLQQPGQLQQIPQGQGQTQSGQRITANRPVTAENNDRTIAALLTICNQAEVECAKLAAENAQHSKVRAFAESLARDHAGIVEQLRGITANNNQAVTTPAGNQTSQPNQFPASQQAPAIGNGSQVGGFDFIAIEQQIAQENLNAARHAWKDKKAQECDMAYVGTQMVVHAQALSKLKVLEQYASAQLKPIIEKEIEATKAHKDKAKELIEQLAKEERSESRSNRDGK